MPMLLTTLIVLPLVFAVVCGLIPKSAKTVGLVGTGLTFLASLFLLFGNGGGAATGGFGFDEHRSWLPALGVSYHVGTDGPAALLIVLTTFLTLFATLYSQNKDWTRAGQYYAFLLALETCAIGAFSSLDLILFFVFFEASLIPTYFLIGIWGGRGRLQAANKFFVYTVVGSLLMLASIIGLYVYTGTFDFVAIRTALSANPLDAGVALWLLAGFLVAFSVKTGVFPLHTWLPDTYSEAPTAGTVLLSGVLAKLGTYGLYRFALGLFPEAAQTVAPFMVALGVVSIVYGALVAVAQKDAKRVLAYSSISHLGFVVLGLFSLTPQGVSGAVLQMVNHGISSGAAFLLLGMIHDRRQTTLIRNLGGLWEQMPVFGRIFLIVVLSSIALPLTNGFVGEFLILLGAFQAFPWAGALAATGVVWSALYMLWMFQRVMYGPVDKPENRRLLDLSGGERGVLVPFVILIFLIGIYPAPFLRQIDAALQTTLGGPMATARALPVPTASVLVSKEKP